MKNVQEERTQETISKWLACKEHEVRSKKSVVAVVVRLNMISPSLTKI